LLQKRVTAGRGAIVFMCVRLFPAPMEKWLHLGAFVLKLFFASVLAWENNM
jgi:hypothetical protein